MRNIVPLFAAFLLLLPVRAAAQHICINEFMPRPLSGEAEWVELRNISASALPLEGWTIEDRTGKRLAIGAEGRVLLPGALLLLTQKLPVGSRWELSDDSVLLVPSFPSLNNSGDDIILRDGEGHVADSITYTASWVGDAGLSVERIDAFAPAERENWSVCLADSGATPGSVNSCSGQGSASVSAGQLVINEIMYDPLPSGCEWIEVFHRGDEDIDLARLELVVSAGSGFDVYRLAPSSGILTPGSFAVIASDSSVLLRFPSLETDTATALLCVLNRIGLGFGNSGDRVLLRDRGGETLDSVDYQPGWHHPFVAETRGISLERISPGMPTGERQSWNSCTDNSGGTPGSRNSVYASSSEQSPAVVPALTVAPVPFSPDGDGFEDLCTISCMAQASIHQARLRIYDIRGRLVRTLLNNAPMASRIDVVWDGLDEEGKRVRIGPYVALLDILDTADNAVAAARGIIVVAVRL
jgi:hypothetical protein